jgi:hypothetical protein
LLLLTVGFALLSSIFYAVTGQAGTPEVQPQAAECLNPPCFGDGTLPSAYDLSVVLSFLGYGLVILLGIPSLVVGTWDLLQGRWRVAGLRLAAFVGPVLIFIGMEIIPHLVNPCGISWLLGERWLPNICEYNPEWGGDYVGKWHLMNHTLMGAVPLTLLYGRLTGCWRPSRKPADKHQHQASR